jgi:hypothetical protein
MESLTFSSDLDDRNMGKLVSSTPISWIRSWKKARMAFQIYIAAAAHSLALNHRQYFGNR